MSEETDRDGPDRRLRRGLAPEREAVERIVRRSLTGGAKAKSSARLPVALAGLVFVVLAVAFAIFVHENGGLEPDTEQADGQETVQILTITNVSGEIEVLYPPGRRAGGSVLSPHKIRDRQSLTIFNSDGLVAVFAPIPATGHFIVGGEP